MSVDASQAFYQDAVAYLNQGKISEAIASLEKCLQINPSFVAAYQLAGDILQSQGKLSEAIAAFNKAITFAPGSCEEAHNKLGITLVMHGRAEEAIAAFRSAVNIRPNYVDALYNLGLALAEKQIDEAIACFYSVLEINPEHLDAGLNLTTLLIQQKQSDEAIICLQEILSFHPGCADAYFNLSSAFLLKKEVDEAIICLETAIDLQPDYAEAYHMLGSIFADQIILNVKFEKTEEAIECFQRAIELKPDYATAYYTYGNVLESEGRVEEALALYQKVLDLEPRHAIAYRAQQLILPIVYHNAAEIDWWRQRFTRGLQNLIRRVCLDTEADRRWALKIMESNNFYLSYQAKNDVELARQYGELAHRIMSTVSSQWSLPVREQGNPNNKKIKVGFLSYMFKNHSTARAIFGWLKHIDKGYFEIYCYYTHREVDRVTKQFQSISDVFYQIPDDDGDRSVPAICQQVIADKLDILIFTDLGMRPQTTQIASLRLAPVQCTCWGHPITSGLPTIDYYLSSDVMEPEDRQIAQSHYTETLIRLPKLGISYVKPTILEAKKDRAFFQLNDESIIYLSCQAPFKYLPQHDYLFAAIAQRVPQAKFVFITRDRKSFLAKQFEFRLKKAFETFGINSHDYCVVLPFLNFDDYCNLSLVSDVFLDTIGFSGGCTSLDAIACNLPIVTLPGEFMRGRHAYGMLKVLGVTDTIAYSETEYIEIAAKLGLDRNWRQQIVERIANNHDRLYEDTTCVTALEDFFRSVANPG